ncbi:Uncharacterized protein C2orf64 like protein [Cyphomyrmex costatus]|uniref:Cytochrome c oxidase assembly factor 5 n=1 Tax=Cyphomyrmex costatus TaxID=456900 RepID=A0A195CBJ4_9HYME|nr:Uncharacterized protein C2orf64 like protein [Cyphomyrmex costatus]
MMRYEEEGETLKDKSRCANIRADLKMCLLQSDCCKINLIFLCMSSFTTIIHLYKRTPKDCLRSYDGTVPDECFALHRTFFDCKHSIIDGKRRFRGPKGY